MNNITNAQPLQAVAKLIDLADLYRYQNDVQPRVIVYHHSGEAATPWFVAVHDGVAVSRIIEMCATQAQALATYSAVISPPSDWPSDDEIDAIFARPARLTDEQMCEMEQERVGAEFCEAPYLW
jgi:hypothetical protein